MFQQPSIFCLFAGIPRCLMYLAPLPVDASGPAALTPRATSKTTTARATEQTASPPPSFRPSAPVNRCRAESPQSPPPAASCRNYGALGGRLAIPVIGRPVAVSGINHTPGPGARRDNRSLSARDPGSAVVTGDRRPHQNEGTQKWPSGR